jgi:hypothetical protein
MKKILVVLSIIMLLACNTSGKQDHQLTRVKKAVVAPILDGLANDAVWQRIKS